MNFSNDIDCIGVEDVTGITVTIKVDVLGQITCS